MTPASFKLLAASTKKSLDPLECRNEKTLGDSKRLSHGGRMQGTPQTHLAAEGMVVSNPNILEGKAIFLGTRVPVSTFFEYLAEGLSLDYFLESFPSVTRDHAVAVLRYGQRRIETELAA